MGCDWDRDFLRSGMWLRQGCFEKEWDVVGAMMLQVHTVVSLMFKI